MNIEHYSKIAPQYYSNHISNLARKYLLSAHFDIFLDCGCGDGNLLNALYKNNLLANKKVFAIDLSKNRIELIKKINRNIIANIDDAEEMSTIENNSIDFFVSTQVIEHVDDKKMIASIIRVMKNDGTIYISTVFKKWYAWYFYRNQGRWVIDPTHEREYRRDEELLELFNKEQIQLLENKKTLLFFPILDFIIKRLNISNRNFYNILLFKILRIIKVPIPGYYNWEIVLKKI